uniref:Uncharacterized protein n=1 Tax=Setaria italica TaxID=4555 RepID=K3YYZ4_SETIT
MKQEVAKVKKKTQDSAELLGVLENLKGITSNQVASECVLQSYTSGNTQLVNRTDEQALSQF